LDLNTVLCDLNGLAGGYPLPELVQDGNKRAGEGTLITFVPITDYISFALY
jgi:hypothetical protein